MENPRELMERLLKKITNQSAQAELFRLNSQSLSVGFRNAELREMEESQNEGLCLRIIKNGKIAQVSFSNMEKANHMIDRVLELVLYGESVEFAFPKGQNIPEIEFQIHKSSLTDMVETGRIIVEKLESFNDSLVSSSSVSREKITIQMMNSEGLDESYERTSYSAFAAAVLTEGKNILTSYDLHIGQNPVETPELLADRVLRILKIGRRNIPFKSETLPVIFTPFAFSDLIAAFSAGINGNSVAKGISPLVGKLGEQILDSRINILDDGLINDAAGSQPFDDEGVPCQRKHIVENGVLKNYLLDLRSASKLNLLPTGNGFRYTSLIQTRSFNAAPSPNFTNLVFEPGSKPLKDMLKEQKRVVLIDQLSGVLLGNLINGDWSGNLELGILYEHGEPIGRIKNAMTSGNFYSMLKDRFVEASKNAKWISGFGGASGSSYLPYVLIDSVNISAQDQ